MIAFASDFDGTIYFGHEHPYRQTDLDAIKSFSKKGLFGICTGRPKTGLLCFTKGYIDFDFYIFSSGALILDKELNVLSKKILDINLVEKVIDHVSDRCLIALHTENQLYTLEERVGFSIPHKQIGGLREIKDKEILSLALRCKDENEASSVLDYLHNNFSEEIEAFQNHQYVDVVAKNCSKGIGIDIIREKLKIELFYGIGDSDNDKPMLERVDVAFTFHSSPDLLKQVCTHVVDSVAQAMELVNK